MSTFLEWCRVCVCLGIYFIARRFGWCVCVWSISNWLQGAIHSPLKQNIFALSTCKDTSPSTIHNVLHCVSQLTNDNGAPKSIDIPFVYGSDMSFKESDKAMILGRLKSKQEFAITLDVEGENEMKTLDDLYQVYKENELKKRADELKEAELFIDNMDKKIKSMVEDIDEWNVICRYSIRNFRYVILHCLSDIVN